MAKDLVHVVHVIWEGRGAGRLLTHAQLRCRAIMMHMIWEEREVQGVSWPMLSSDAGLSWCTWYEREAGSLLIHFQLRCRAIMMGIIWEERERCRGVSWSTLSWHGGLSPVPITGPKEEMLQTQHTGSNNSRVGKRWEDTRQQLTKRKTQKSV